MQEAAALNRADCIHILLEYDADTNVANDQGVTPLHEVRPSRECCASPTFLTRNMLAISMRCVRVRVCTTSGCYQWPPHLCAEPVTQRRQSEPKGQRRLYAATTRSLSRKGRLRLGVAIGWCHHLRPVYIFYCICAHARSLTCAPCVNIRHVVSATGCSSRRMMGALIGTLCDAKLNEQESQVVDKMDTVGQLKEELAAAQAALAEKDATLASKEATLQQLSRESSAANEQLSSMKQESTTLRKQSQALEDENRRIKLELEALRQQQQLLQQQQQQQQQSFLAQQQQYQLLLQQQQTGGVAAAAALISPTKDSSPEGAATAPGASATNPSIVATANTPTLTRLGSGTMSAEDQAIVARNYLKQVRAPDSSLVCLRTNSNLLYASAGATTAVGR